MRGAREVEEALERLGLAVEAHALPDDAHTVQQTADALAASPAQVVKSIAVRRAGSDETMVVLAAGTEPIDLDALGRRLGCALELVPGKEVERATGYPPGVVPPVGLAPGVRVVLDESFPEAGLVFTGAGVPGAVLAHRADELRRVLVSA
jgi:prolyl-tRNA editing enzyme YbaK/EbsC (Cys-tRNA(Pro) deacylase)